MELDLDANNNSTDRKGYSLRPRSAPKHSDSEEVVREEVKQPRGRTPRSSKQKGLPLSKYRRKTANARERSRMREINEAFETLRKSIPLISTKCDNPSEKNTKISTLRLAMKYITVLTSALKDSDGDSDKDSIFSEYSLTPPDYRDTHTPTSTSDNSDFSEPFFSTNLPLDRPSHCVSPVSSSSSFNLFEVISKSRLPKWNEPEFKGMTIRSEDVERISPNVLPSVSTFGHHSTVKPPPSYELSRLTSLEDQDLLVPPPPYSSSLETDLRFASLTPISVQLHSTPVLEDLDDLNFSRVDLDDLLCT